MFSPSNASYVEFLTVCSLVLTTSCNLSPRFLLRLYDTSVLQSIITFNAKSLRKNLLLVAFLVYPLIHISAFCILDHICLRWLVNCYDLIFVLYAFHLMITYQSHLLLLLSHYFHVLLLIQPFIHTHTQK